MVAWGHDKDVVVIALELRAYAKRRLVRWRRDRRASRLWRPFARLAALLMEPRTLRFVWRASRRSYV